MPSDRLWVRGARRGVLLTGLPCSASGVAATQDAERKAIGWLPVKEPS
jgi:hypothetical protein